MHKTKTRTGFLHADQKPLINIEVLEWLIAWRNWCYYQEQQAAELRRRQLVEDVREAAEEEGQP